MHKTKRMECTNKVAQVLSYTVKLIAPILQIKMIL